PVRFGPASGHPLPAEAAKRFSIQSMLAMAIYPKGDEPYMLGLHQCSYARAWTPQEERLFQEIGRRLEDALTSLLMFRSLRVSGPSIAAWRNMRSHTSSRRRPRSKKPRPAYFGPCATASAGTWARCGATTARRGCCAA